MPAPLSSTTAGLSSSSNAPRLLQQMQLMMGQWRHGPAEGQNTVDGTTPPSSADPAAAWERRMMNHETAQSALKLYIASAGVYEPILKEIMDYEDRMVDELYDELRKARGRVAVVQAKPTVSPGGTSRSRSPGAGEVPPRAQSAPTAVDGEAADKCDYAFSRVANAEQRMVRVVEESRGREENASAKIMNLEAEVRSLELQLEEQILKVRRVAKESDGDRKLTREELSAERQIIDLERALAKELKTVEERDETITTLRTRVNDLRELNGKYARQALEMAARVRVYSEHNDKFATLLSMQHDEKLATERENELLRKELIDLNQFHQLRDNLEGEGGSLTQHIDTRAIRHGLGANATIPKHLHYSGLMNRLSMAKDSALTMVSDILSQRISPVNQRYDFCTFLHHYLHRRHDKHAISWAYSLDEATRYFDSEVNLNLFGKVSRRELPEQLYKDIAVDQQIFLAGCELMDAMQHGTPKMTVPVPHIVGFLVEMFPGYPDSAFKNITDHLNATLTSNGQAHYRMLFPNLEREDISSADAALAHLEVRKENRFSQAFKELIMDDCAVSLTLLEDEIHRIPHDKISLTDVKELVSRLYTLDAVAKEVHAQVRRVMLDFLGSSGNYQVSIAKNTFINLMRTRATVRKGIFRLEGSFSSSPARLQPLMLYSAGKGDVGRTVMNNLAPVDYRDVLQNLSVKRMSYLTEEDIRQEEEEKKRKEAERLAADAEAMLERQGDTSAEMQSSVVGSPKTTTPPLGATAGSAAGSPSSP